MMVRDTNSRLGMDFVTLALMGFVAMVIILLLHIGKKQQETEDHKPQGNVVVELFWGDSLDSDVDLWVQAPHDVPVGFSNKGGIVFNLLRDDLGIHADVSGKNYEVSYSRGVPDGTYQVNVHLYNPKTAKLPILCKVVVSVKKNDTASLIQILSANVSMERHNQEKTVFHFDLRDGELDKGSVHHTPKSLVMRGGHQ